MGTGISYAASTGAKIGAGGKEIRTTSRGNEHRGYEMKKKNIFCMFVHDMKNPVMSAGVSIARLLSGKMGTLTDVQKDYLTMAKDSLGKMENLLIQFIEFLRIESKEYVPSFYPLDIVTAISRNIDYMKNEASKKDIEILFEHTQTAPSVHADLMMLNSIVSNLLDNAIKYTDAGGSITVRVSDGDDNVEVRITDTGSGIPENHVPYIFNPFFRVQRDTEGSGLGLFIVKSMVEAHGGKIRVESIPGEGSSFSFRLPKYRSASA